MADNYQYITATGLIVPDTSTILAQVQAEWQTAFGADLIVTTDTPQGVMIAAETTARSNSVNNNAAVANQTNPNTAGGVFLDAIMALTGIQRASQQPTVVPGVTLTGIAGVTVPAGVRAQTTNGDLFESVSSVQIGAGGSATVDFQSVVDDAIPAPIGSLTTIVTGVIGWETVNNTATGVLGSATQSDQAARAYRLNTLAFQGVSLAEAITSALYATTSVRSLSFRENYTDAPAGALVGVTDGSTLNDTVWGVSNTAPVVIGTDDLTFVETAQTLPTPNPWPVAKYTTTGNVTLSALTTQGNGDWPGTMTGGDLVLVKNQTDPTKNGVYAAAAGSWARQSYFADAVTIQGSIDGLSLLPHSVYACVDGGTDLDVAAALLENKSSGSAWNGGTSIPVVEPASGQSYTVLFDRPQEVGILINITITNAAEDDVKAAILAFAAGQLDGLPGFVVGQDVSPFEIAGAVTSKIPNCYISSVTISLSAGSPSFSSNPIPIGLNQQAQTQEGYIVVTIA